MTNRKNAVLHPQVSATLRFVAAAGVCVLLALVWVVAEHESHKAVDTATAALSGPPVPGALPTVQVAGRRAASARRS